jgi:AcrR family transcriptional regulator
LRRDAERNRQRILIAARTVFADRRLEAMLDDIADHARVGVGTVYCRFADKEALVGALVGALVEQRIDDDLVAIAERASSVPDSWAAVVYLLTESMELLAVDRGLRRGGHCTTYGRGRVARAPHPVLPASEPGASDADCGRPGVRQPRAAAPALIQASLTTARRG